MANHNPVITNTLPTWVFIQATASGECRHEIQRVSSGFMVFVNVSDENGGGCLGLYQSLQSKLIYGSVQLEEIR